MTVKDRGRLDDHWSRKARLEGYPARSVWKLEEFDLKHNLIRPGMRVLDLGCAPGSWTLYAAEKVGPRGLVRGLDLDPPEGASFPAWASVGRADIRLASPELVRDLGPFDLVLSDMAPSTTGRREADQAGSLELCSLAWDWAGALLKKGGHFLFKIFQSSEGDAFVRSLAPFFERQVRLKPKATRSKSQELFVLGTGFKGREQSDD